MNAPELDLGADASAPLISTRATGPSVLVPTLAMRLRYTLHAPLGEEAIKRVRDVPGVNYWTKYGYVVDCPLNAGWLIEPMLAPIPYNLRLPHDYRTPFPKMEETTEKVRDILTQGVELRPWVWDFSTPYQREGAGLCHYRGGGYLIHAAGAGKTLACILFALATPGPIVVVTPAAVRSQWRSQVERFTTLRPHCIDPALYARKGAELLPAYLERMRSSGERPFVVTPWESLGDHVEALAGLHPVTVVFDEIHYAKQWRRDRFVPLIGGGVKPVDLRNRSSFARALSRAAQRRIGASATPIPDRVRDLWAQFDLIEPGAWGLTYTKFAFAYAAARETDHGLDTRGSSNPGELGRRLAFSVHRVPYSVSHGHLPPVRNQTTILPRERQCRPIGGFAKLIKEANEIDEESITIARLMEAASRKRPYVVERILEFTAQGGKCVVFTGLHKDCERLAGEIEKALRSSPCGAAAWFGWCHGGHSTLLRNDLREAYLAHRGAAVLVGTGDSLGTGQDLNDTDYACLAMLPYTPGKLTQWRGRFPRLGMVRPVLIEAIVAEGTADEIVADILLAKLPAIEKLVGDENLAGIGKSLRGLDDEEAVLRAMYERIAKMTGDLDE